MRVHMSTALHKAEKDRIAATVDCLLKRHHFPLLLGAKAPFFPQIITLSYAWYRRSSASQGKS